MCGRKLAWIAENASVEAASAVATSGRRIVPGIAVGVVVGVLLAIVAVRSFTHLPSEPVLRLEISMSPTQQLENVIGRSSLAFSPNGTHIVYVANDQLYLRAMNSLDATPVPGTEGGASNPFFSGDGQWLGYWADDGKLKKVSINGGTTTTLCDAERPSGASWGPDDIILFGQDAGVFRVSGSGVIPKFLSPSTRGNG